MSAVVLFAIGSPIAVDTVETCRRLGLRIAAAIRNRPGEAFVGQSVPVVDIDGIPPGAIDLPLAIPLFAPANRRIALAEAQALGFRNPAILVDPTATLAAGASVAPGSYVNAGCIVGGEGELGPWTFLNRGANLGHHVRIGAFASIGPGAILAGMVNVGEDAVIGAGAIVLPKVSIGAGAHVAPGAVVARDIPVGGFAAGNPARILARPLRPAAGDGGDEG